MTEQDSKGRPFAIIVVLAIAFVWWEYREQAAQSRRDRAYSRAFAEQTKKYKELESRLLDRFRSRSMSVLGELPVEFDVLAVGADDAHRRIDVAHPIHEQFGHVDVIVNHAERPVVLVLTAYDPIAWRIGHTEDTTIAAVIASGYHTQVIVLPDVETVPIANSTYDEYGGFHYFYFYRSGDPNLLAADRIIRDLTGKGIERYYSNRDDSDVVYVGQPPSGMSPVTILDDDSFALRVASHLESGDGK